MNEKERILRYRRGNWMRQNNAYPSDAHCLKAVICMSLGSDVRLQMDGSPVRAKTVLYAGTGGWGSP